MNFPQKSTGCLGVNRTKDLQPVKTPEGNEYIVQLGVFGTSNVAGHYTYAVEQHVIDSFNQRRNLVVVHQALPGTPEAKVAALSTTNMGDVCAALSDVKTTPLGRKQLVTGKIKPFGPHGPWLQELLDKPDTEICFGMRASVTPVKTDKGCEHFIEILHGFNLVSPP